VTRLRANAETFRRLAREAGADTGGSAGTPVIPAIVGDSLRAVRLANRLTTLGVSAPPMVSPSVPEGHARLRFFVTAEHSDPQLHDAASALSTALREPLE
jgi:7-keto-8-aminopelargonate synthetase-like enzyme